MFLLLTVGFMVNITISIIPVSDVKFLAILGAYF
jgi:hypothetical protein